MLGEKVCKTPLWWFAFCISTSLPWCNFWLLLIRVWECKVFQYFILDIFTFVGLFSAVFSNELLRIYFNISSDIFTFWAAMFHLYPKIMICCVSYWKCMKYKSWVFLLSFQPQNNTSNISEYIMYHYLPQRNSDSPKPMDFQKSFSGSPTPATLGTSFSISI